MYQELFSKGYIKKINKSWPHVNEIYTGIKIKLLKKKD